MEKTLTPGCVRMEFKDGLQIATYDFRDLKDRPPIEHKIFPVEVKDFSDQDLIVEHFINTEERDRGGDRLLADGMRIKGRVVVLMAHGFSNQGQEPIGKPLRIWPDTHNGVRGVCARTQFYDGSNLNPPDSTGRRLYEKIKSGFLPNWSIGWIPLLWEDSTDQKGQTGRDVLEWELLEYSPVGVPMNPGAQTFNSSGQSALSYKNLSGDKKPPKVMVHLGDGKFCRLENLSTELGKMLEDYTRKMFKRIALGKID
jgi:hypothetical protein